MAPNNTFSGSPDQSDNLANRGKQIIEFFHVPTGFSVKFKAFVTQFDDAYSSEWMSETSFGRMDPIQSFQSTSRKISLGFDVVAGSTDEGHSNMQRVSLLLQMLYPSYDSATGGATTIKAAPYFKLNFMNLAANSMNGSTTGAKLAGLLGTIDGFTYSPDLEAGFFFDELNEATTIPKSVNLNCTFTVLHENKLGWVKKVQRPGFGNFPYLKTPIIDDLSTFAEQGFPIPTMERRTDLTFVAASDDDFKAAEAAALEAPVSSKEANAYYNQQTSPSANNETEVAFAKKKRKEFWAKKAKEREAKVRNAKGWNEE